MSNAKQILSMLRSRAEGDEDRFLAIALQVAAGEARQGRRTNADEIRAAVEELRGGTMGTPSVQVALAEPRGDLAGLLTYREPAVRLTDVVLSDVLKSRLEAVLVQQRRRAVLREHGRVPARRLLFAGPPGSGKTMTAEALAGELKLPLMVVRLETLITRYMGETATQLRQVFDETLRRRAVYLFDEFDAVGAHRRATNDVAEMRRVLNSFLQFMEEPTSTDSLLIAATNHPDLLDGALQRRFDEVLPFEMPTADQVRAVMEGHMVPMKGPRIAWTKVAQAASGLSQAEIGRAADEAVKAAILGERGHLTTTDLVKELAARQSIRDVFGAASD
jgi:SpoVK/Ycf46/Vps4 family AAA+-type ATPase